MFYSRFLPGVGGGGARREAQLIELLSPLGFDFHSVIGSPFTTSAWSRADHLYLWYLRRHALETRCWDPLYAGYVTGLQAVARRWAGELRHAPKPRLALVDDPLFLSPLVRRLHRLAVPVVALCQNLESLSAAQVKPTAQLRLLDRELGLLQRCALTVTISREETVLLRNLGVAVHHLPFSPSAPDREALLAVRERRRESAQADFLMLGSAANKVTADGMRRLIGFWESSPDLPAGERLLVAGYDTDTYLGGEDSARVIRLGALSGPALSDRLASVKALICHQDQGAGALTRIPEAIIAGVPVAASRHAARSHEGLPGLATYATLRDLPRALRDLTPGVPPLPAEDPRPGRDLLDMIARLLDGPFSATASELCAKTIKGFE